MVWIFSWCKYHHDVNIVRVWMFSWCEYCHCVNIIMMWILSWCEYCPCVNVIMMWILSLCEYYHDVNIVMVWILSWCEYYHDGNIVMCTGQCIPSWTLLSTWRPCPPPHTTKIQLRATMLVSEGLSWSRGYAIFCLNIINYVSGFNNEMKRKMQGFKKVFKMEGYLLNSKDEKLKIHIRFLMSNPHVGHCSDQVTNK